MQGDGGGASGGWAGGREGWRLGGLEAGGAGGWEGWRLGGSAHEDARARPTALGTRSQGLLTFAVCGPSRSLQADAAKLSASAAAKRRDAEPLEKEVAKREVQLGKLDARVNEVRAFRTV
jgi:hypothetical protein